MKIQFAIDTLTTAHALELAAAAAPHVDVLELGTPLIKAEGLPAITAMKEAFPDKIVFADLKTMDAGELEADIAFQAGADLVTVLGVADDSTIAGAVKAAKAHGKGIVVDLIGVKTKPAAPARSSNSEPSTSRCTPVWTSRPSPATHSTPCSRQARPLACRSRSPEE